MTFSLYDKTVDSETVTIRVTEDIDAVVDNIKTL